MPSLSNSRCDCWRKRDSKCFQILQLQILHLQMTARVCFPVMAVIKKRINLNIKTVGRGESATLDNNKKLQM